MLQYNGYNIRVIEKNDNKQVCDVIKGVFYELGLPLVGTAYADKDTLSMYEAYQDSRSIYYVVEKEDSVFGGCGIKQLSGTNENICELQKFYFHKKIMFHTDDYVLASVSLYLDVINLFLMILRLLNGERE